jgi:hypothetical protein
MGYVYQAISSSWMRRHPKYPLSLGGDAPHAAQILGGGQAVSPAEQAGVPPKGLQVREPEVAAGLAEQ